MMGEIYEGSCHCGAIGYSYQTAIAPRNWSIRACQCSFCLAHDALSTSDSNGLIDFQAHHPEALQKYRFGLLTADFLLCRTCGVYIGAAIETEHGSFGIINVHTLVEIPADMAEDAPISYDSEDVGGRVSRRAKRWTPLGELPWHEGIR